MKNMLFLGSKSPSRQMLLKEAQIPFLLVNQDADEAICDYGLTLKKLVQSIALQKMNHVILPHGKTEGEICFVLTADTLSQDKDGTINGKPTDRTDAKDKIRKAREGSQLYTAFCLDKRRWTGTEWIIKQRIEQQVGAQYQFIIPDIWIDWYLDNSLGLQASNAIAIEGTGAQFLKTVSGSYSTIVGLPMFELRESLEQIGFFDSL